MCRVCRCERARVCVCARSRTRVHKHERACMRGWLSVQEWFCHRLRRERWASGGVRGCRSACMGERSSGALYKVLKTGWSAWWPRLACGSKEWAPAKLRQEWAPTGLACWPHERWSACFHAWSVAPNPHPTDHLPHAPPRRAPRRAELVPDLLNERFSICSLGCPCMWFDHTRRPGPARGGPLPRRAGPPPRFVVALASTVWQTRLSSSSRSSRGPPSLLRCLTP
jgi:hypothetical protein